VGPHGLIQGKGRAEQSARPEECQIGSASPQQTPRLDELRNVERTLDHVLDVFENVVGRIVKVVDQTVTQRAGIHLLRTRVRNENDAEEHEERQRESRSSRRDGGG